MQTITNQRDIHASPSRYGAQLAAKLPTAAAEAVYTYLCSIAGTYALAGMHDENDKQIPAGMAIDHFTQLIRTITGKLPAFIELDLGPDGTTRQAAVDYAIDWWRSGGVVGFCWHERYPGAPERCWPNVLRKDFQTEEWFARVLTPGTMEHDALLRDIDDNARYLLALRDAGVPVLWRPYHEMNCRSFWWGNQPRYTELWDILYARLTGQWNLDNLIWVWSPIQNNGYGNAYDPFYPGDSSVDILGLDIYSNTNAPEFRKSYYTELIDVCPSKPVWIAETGDHPTPDVLSDQPLWAGFTEWAYMLTDRPFNADREYQRIAETYHDARTITKDKLPRFIS
jgi:mannan endo-1,4-beta-mannosidase